MNWINSTCKTAGALIITLLFVSTMTATAQDAEDIIASISERIELTQDQESMIRDLDPTILSEDAGLWYVSARLQSVLTDDQKVSLIRDGRRGQPIMRRGTELRSREGRHMPFGLGGQEMLSDEQREQIRESMRAMAEEHRELREQRRNEEIDLETYRERLQGIHEEMRAEAEEMLTDEQLEQMREHHARAEERMSEYRTRDEDNGERDQRPRYRRSSWAGPGIAREQREVLAIYRMLIDQNNSTASNRNYR